MTARPVAARKLARRAVFLPERPATDRVSATTVFDSVFY